MTTYRLTPAAVRDLSSIWDDTEEHGDAQQAEIYLAEIRAAIERVAQRPERGRSCDDGGRSCDDVREGYLRYAIGSHVIFYRANPHTVDVIRILHQRMDPTLHF